MAGGDLVMRNRAMMVRLAAAAILAASLMLASVARAAPVPPPPSLTALGGAPLASPAFTGTPTAPTPSAGDNSGQLATTAWVNSAEQFSAAMAASFAATAYSSFGGGL